MRLVLEGQRQHHTIEYGGRTFDAVYEPLRNPDGEVVGVVGVGHDITERQRTEEELRLRTLELEQSRRRIMETQEALRKELAEVLHGRVQSKLLVAVANLKEAQRSLNGDSKEAMTRIARATEFLEAANEHDLRTVARQLHPSTIRLGLISSIRSLMSDGGLPFETTLQVEDGVTALEHTGTNGQYEQTKLAAYRIAEEALGNISKHAGATKAEISLGLSPGGQLKINVQDDGCGFDPGGRSPGLGILVMQDYAGALGGDARVESSPGRGTRVEAALPLTTHSTDRRPAPVDRSVRIV